MHTNTWFAQEAGSEGDYQGRADVHVLLKRLNKSKRPISLPCQILVHKLSSPSATGGEEAQFLPGEREGKGGEEDNEVLLPAATGV